MLEKLAENLKSMPDDLQVEVLSRAIMACRGCKIEDVEYDWKKDGRIPYEKREELLGRALDFLEAWMIVRKIPWDEESVATIKEWHRKIESGEVKR